MDKKKKIWQTSILKSRKIHELEGELNQKFEKVKFNCYLMSSSMHKHLHSQDDKTPLKATLLSRVYHIIVLVSDAAAAS